MNAKQFSDMLTKVYSLMQAEIEEDFLSMAFILCEDDKVLMVPTSFTDDLDKAKKLNACRRLYLEKNGVAYGFISEAWMHRGVDKIPSDNPDKESVFAIESVIDNDRYICIKSAITGEVVNSSEEEGINFESTFALNESPRFIPGPPVPIKVYESTLPLIKKMTLDANEASKVAPKNRFH